MKLNRKLFGMSLTLTFAMSFCVVANAMENNTKYNNISSISINNINYENEFKEKKENILDLKKKLKDGIDSGMLLLSKFKKGIGAIYKVQNCYKVFRVEEYAYYIYTYIVLKKILKSVNLFNPMVERHIFNNFFNRMNKQQGYGIIYNVFDFDFCDSESFKIIKNAIENVNLRNINISREDLEDAIENLKKFLLIAYDVKNENISRFRKIELDTTNLLLLEDRCIFFEYEKKRLENLKSKTEDVDENKINYIIKCFDMYIELLKKDIESLKNGNGVLKFIDDEDIKCLKNIIKDTKKKMLAHSIDVTKMNYWLENCLEFGEDFYNLNRYLTLKV